MTPEEIKTLQTDLGIETKDDFARLIGVNVSTLRYWMRGTMRPDKRNLEALKRLRAKADREQKEHER